MCHHLGSAPCTAMVPEPSATEDPVTQTVIIVQQPGDPRPTLHRGVDVVELSTTPVERQRCSSQSARHGDRHRCFPDRLGGSLQQCVHRRTVVPRGEEPPHQLPGAPSGLLCSAVLHKGQGEHPCSPSNGQQHCPPLCQQDGGDPLPSLTEQACHLWQWCLQRNIILSAEYLPGISNIVADRESRLVQTSAEWKLDEEVFRNVFVRCSGHVKWIYLLHGSTTN